MRKERKGKGRERGIGRKRGKWGTGEGIGKRKI